MDTPVRTELADRLHRAIAAEPGGVLPFEEFMRRALYEPGLGYYERSPRGVGRDGDFYTNVSVGPLFGELLAHQFAGWLDASGAPPRIVEAGAHDGRLAGDVLDGLRRARPDLFGDLEYWIVEPSPAREAWQRERLAPFEGRVRWSPTLPATTAVCFSNELLDAFPVRPVRWDARAGRWQELGVGVEGGAFREAPMPRRADTPVPDLPPEVLAVLPDGFTTETSPAAEAWWQGAAKTLAGGHLLAIDYGLTAEEFLVPRRLHGTRRGYRRHRFTDDLLAEPGECDLTAHVNFTRIQQVGERCGWRTEGLSPQHACLTRILSGMLSGDPGRGDWTPAQVRQFQTLTHPEHLGRGFRWLVQAR